MSEINKSPQWWHEPKDYIEEEEVKPVMVRLRCPECGGEMKYNGAVYTTDPYGYHHICDGCGINRVILGEKYPHVEYRDKD